MKRTLAFRTIVCSAIFCAAASLVCAPDVRAQNEPAKFIADTLVVQANGSFEAEPNLATLTFDISSQDKDLTQAYTKAAQSMQQIVTVAQKDGLTKEEIATGVLTLTPEYDANRSKKPKSYFVEGEITLKVHDFTKIGAILNDAIGNGLADFRSLEYSLKNEEAAKERAVADAMHNAVERAKAALAQNGQKPGAIRYANVDIGQIAGITEFNRLSLYAKIESAEDQIGGAPAPPPAPAALLAPTPVQPGKITVSATVQCAFQIQ